MTGLVTRKAPRAVGFLPHPSRLQAAHQPAWGGHSSPVAEGTWLRAFPEESAVNPHAPLVALHPGDPRTTKPKLRSGGTREQQPSGPSPGGLTAQISAETMGRQDPRFFR